MRDGLDLHMDKMPIFEELKSDSSSRSEATVSEVPMSWTREELAAERLAIVERQLDAVTAGVVMMGLILVYVLVLVT